MSGPSVLVLSRNYPNPVLPTLGVWVERLTRASTPAAHPTVIAPTPWLPPVVPLPGTVARHRAIPQREEREGIVVHHPRVLQGPGYWLHDLDAWLERDTIGRLAERLGGGTAFGLIHAHFVYPDGVIAAALGRRWGVPVITTEHAPWLPWLRDRPRVRRQVAEALRSIRVVTTVSRGLAATVERAFSDRPPRTAIVPNVLDDRTFDLPQAPSTRDPDRILFVGVVRRVKGLDILVRALPTILRSRPGAYVEVVGDPYHGGYRRDERAVRRLITDMGLAGRVRFVGQASPREVADAMRHAAVLAVPSRRESFSSVTAEALACGTPVVATRCGGPEEILTPAGGRFVPVEDPEALGAALVEVLANPGAYPAGELRAGVVPRFGWEAAKARIAGLYQAILTEPARAGRPDGA